MAVTENRYTGNGSTVLYSFTFPYLNTTDIKVSLDDVVTTEYTLDNATTVRFNTAPGDGVAIRIYRQTNDDDLNATFYPGSAIRAQDLNDNFTQNLFLTQETVRDSQDANDIADLALTRANTAITTANTATVTADAAEAKADTAIADSATAIQIANDASTDASEAIIKADLALNAVSDVIVYDIVDDVASIPASPQVGDAIRVVDTTGIESFTPLTNLPVGFVGSPELSVEMTWDDLQTTWVYVRYTPNDPETRYLKIEGGTLTGSLVLAGDPVSALQAATKQYVDANSGGGPGAVTSVAGKTGDVILVKADITDFADSDYLAPADIGVTVQAYDADTAKLDVPQTFTAVQTLTDPAIVGTILEDVYTISDAADFEVDPGNGSVQLITLGANRTPKATNFAAGESITLMVDDGSAYTLTWTDATWGGSGVVWTGGSAPELATSGYTVIQLWKVGSQVYGAKVGEVA